MTPGIKPDDVLLLDLAFLNLPFVRGHAVYMSISYYYGLGHINISSASRSDTYVHISYSLHFPIHSQDITSAHIDLVIEGWCGRL